MGLQARIALPPPRIGPYGTPPRNARLQDIPNMARAGLEPATPRFSEAAEGAEEGRDSQEEGGEPGRR